MSASTVTGKGGGAAYGQKGPSNNRDQFIPLAGPHIVIAGATLVTGGSTQKVIFPIALPLTPDKYAVIATSAVSGSITNTSGVLTVTGAGVGLVAVPIDANGVGAVPGVSTYAVNLASAGKTAGTTVGFSTFVATTGQVYWVVVQLGQGIDVSQDCTNVPAAAAAQYSH
jgi:hypothetical protein